MCSDNTTPLVVIRTSNANNKAGMFVLYFKITSSKLSSNIQKCLPILYKYS